MKDPLLPARCPSERFPGCANEIRHVAALNSLVSEAVDLVVYTERGPGGPQVMSITAVEDLTAGPDAVQFTTTELFARPRPGAPLAPTGLLPLRATVALERFGHDVRALLATDEVVS